MTTNIVYKHPLKVSEPESDIVKEIKDLRSEVKSLQKSVALILRYLPQIVHQECRYRGYD